MFDYSCGNTPYHHIGRDIFHNHRVGGYDRIIAHGDIAQNLCAAVDVTLSPIVGQSEALVYPIVMP